MAVFRDEKNEPRDWLHDLARSEVLPDLERALEVHGAGEPQRLIEESTINFLTHLRDRLNEFTRTFNSYSEGGVRFSEIKIYSITNTAADFMLFRNQIKLSFTNSAHGVIQITLAQHQRGVSTHLNFEGNNQFSHEIAAQLGPFKTVHWVYNGERIEPDQVARFFFAEFAKWTKAQERPRSGNQQALMEQIKNLLHKNGLDV